MDTKGQIVGWVHRIDQLRAETKNLWTKAQEHIAGGRVDDAISLLNAYFSQKEELTLVEAKLASTLHASFSDK